MFKLRKEKAEYQTKPIMEYCVQVVRNIFTNEMVNEIISAEFNRLTSSTDEVIMINSNTAKQVLSLDKWPFVVKTDGSFNTLYIAYANEKKGITKIDCFVIDGIDREVEADLNANNGIIRISKNK